MSVTLYSFLMAIVWSSIFVVVLVLLRRNNEFIYSFGTTSLMFLFAGFIIRLALPIEFPFVKEIELYDGLYAKINLFLKSDLFNGILIIDVITVIWLMISAILIIKLIVKHVRFTNAMLRLKNCITPQIIACQKLIESELDVKNVHIICSSHFKLPMCLGVKNLVLLPNIDYNDEELYYILKHEYTHLKNKDLHLKMLIEVFIAIFWWNPFVYLLRYNLADVLEIKCDLAVVGNSNHDDKMSYLQTIVNMLKKSSNDNKQEIDLRLATAELGNDLKENNLIQRFNIVIKYKPTKRKSVFYFSSFIIAMLFTLSVSYMFVLQPANTAPQEEIVEDGRGYEMTPDNTYILETEDGKYILVSDNGFENEIDNEFKEMLILDGFEVEEE